VVACGGDGCGQDNGESVVVVEGHGGERKRIVSAGNQGEADFWLTLESIFLMLRPWNPPQFIGEGVEGGNLVFIGEKMQPLIQLEMISTVG